MLFNNRKLHTGFLLVRKSVTLNNVEHCCVVVLFHWKQFVNVMCTISSVAERLEQ